MTAVGPVWLRYPVLSPPSGSELARLIQARHLAETRAAFWLARITDNKARDRRVNCALRARGWTVLRIWEHELKRKNEARHLRRLTSACQL